MSASSTRLRALRNHLARGYIKRRLARREVSLVSDDCWGGRFYAELGLKCLSPFVGMGFDPWEYIDFLLHMREPGALDVQSISSEERGYPIIQTRHARLFGLHYASDEEFLKRYQRRCTLIDWSQVFIKIDFGKPKYRPEHIERWNILRPPRSVALYPDEPRYRALKIHHGVAVSNWELDGARQFNLSARCFDLFTWVNEDRIHAPPSYRLLHFLLMDRYLIERWRSVFRRSRDVA